MKPLYRIDLVWNGDHFVRDVIAFDFGITHPNCLTIYHKEGGCIVIREDGIECIEITSLRG